MTWLAYSHLGVAKAVQLTTQPAVALAGIPFGVQPVGRLVDGSGVLSRATGVTVTASKAGGAGTLSGTLSVQTVEGVFTFTDLKMDTVTSAVTLSFASSGLTGATSSAFNVTQPNTIIGCEVGTYAVTGTAQTLTRGPYLLRPFAPGSYAITGTAATLTGPSARWRANEPPGLTAIGGLNYSQTVPAGWGNERFLAAPDQAWSVITDANLANNGSNFSQATDASAPRSPSAVWQVHVEPGTWTQGHTVARMGRQLGMSASTVYACFSVKWDVGFPFNTISTKMFQWSPGTLLCQARHGSNYLRCSSEDIGQDYDAFIVDGSQPTLGVWHIVEVLFIRGNPGTVKVWLDGAIRTDCTSLPVAPSAPLTEFFNSCHLGGGGMTITADSYMWYDEIYLSGA